MLDGMNIPRGRLVQSDKIIWKSGKDTAVKILSFRIFTAVFMFIKSLFTKKLNMVDKQYYTLYNINILYKI